MNEKSFLESSRKEAMAAAMAAGLGEPPGGVAPGVLLGGGPHLALRAGCPPNRPPDKLSQPSTRSLKKGVRTNRFEVRPPCECPTSQNALMFSFPICPTTDVTMFCRYSSSASDQNRVGELGVAITRRYLSLKSRIGK